ncbi:hypothetical protein [Actinacidiphila rubida]|uniref:Uncharacterized protein n=1 Tax=Actinacidiphila rubida TaxID=310780 RepID=A0A1H8JG92_9ACTN|nr:hypothetical protein [Actinacidiphila rubida]SEN79873.1 hypothetical protein SAMN05216267_1010109 [Actinacidiphila rubida]
MVSAIPENLIKYSATCTAAAQELQNWVRSVLTPALLAYQNTGQPCVDLDGEVAVAISRAYYTDRDVHDVARAFQATQHGGALGPGGLVRAHESDVDTAYTQLLAQNQAKMRAGAALAARLTPLQDLGDRDNPDAARPIVEELAKHANDPYFCAGFFNALTLQPLLTTVLALGGIPALISAYSSGAVSPHTTAMVAARIGIPAVVGGPESPTSPFYRMTSEQKAQLLDALAANPSAAYHFAKALTPAEVREMFYGDRQYSGKVMAVLQTAMNCERSPQAARELMHKVSLGLFGSGAPKLSNSDWKSLIGPVRAFYGTGMLNSVPAPTDFSRDGLEEWEHIAGAQNGEDLALFLKALHDSQPDDALVKSMVQGGYVNAVFLLAGPLEPEAWGAKIAFSAALGTVQSVVSANDPIIENLGLSAGRYPDTDGMNEKLALGGFAQTLTLLAMRNQLRDPSNHLVHLTGDQATDRNTLREVLSGDLTRYTVGGTDGARVSELLDAYKSQELEAGFKAITSPHYSPPYE